MEDLFKSNLKTAKKLKKLTLNINELSLKTDYNKVNSLIEERQTLIDKINTANDRISIEKNNKDFIETDEIKKLNKEISSVFVEIYEIDNIIRKNINSELRIVKEKLNQSEEYTVVNIKI